MAKFKISPFLQKNNIIGLLLFSCVFYISNLSALEVSNSIPNPNYHLTKSANDLVELTDGVVHQFPAWIRKESVGWKAASAILLEINLDLPENQMCDSGTLEIFSSKQKSSGVSLPRRIDIYEDNKHIKYVNIDNAGSANQQAHTITIPLKNIGNTFAMVIHSSGAYTMIDEIAWVSDLRGCDPKVKQEIKFKKANPQKIIADSKRRLTEQLFARMKPVSKPNKILEVGFADPWGVLPTQLTGQEERSDSMILKGFNNTKETFVVGIAGGCEHNQSYKVKLTSSPEIRKKVRMFEIQKQLVLDGSIVFDPLVPLQSNKLDCSNSWNTYLWISIDFDENINSEKITVEIQSEKNDIKAVEVDLQIENFDQSGVCELNVINWAYPQDKPVWDTQTDLYQDLANYGVNVFVIHPALLKLPNSVGKVQNINKKEIINQIKKIRESNKSATILFYMAISRWFDKSQQLTESQREKVLTEWVTHMDQFLRKEGYSRDQWMLYPADEPVAKRLEQLFWTIDLIKKVSPDIRIYANPIAVHSRNKITYGQLKELSNKVDIIQPDFELVREQMTFFQNLDKPWWFYDNPTYPAKKTEPYFYRSLALKAWALGASGTGFWSYSDTSNTSAWDDFDGNRGDWAVVYEGKENIISSRRWEAVAQGMNDYRFLCASERLDLHNVQINNDRFNVKLKKELDDPKALVELLIKNKNFVHGSIQ